MHRTPFTLFALTACQGTDEGVAPSSPVEQAADDTALDSGTVSPPVLAEGFEEELTVTGGCGDALIYAADGEQTRLLVFEAEGVAERAWQAGQMTRFGYALPAESVTLRVEVGSGLLAGICGSSTGPRTVDHIYLPVAGELSLSVTPDAEAADADAFPSTAVLVVDRARLAQDEDPDEKVLVAGYRLTAAIGGSLP